MAMIYALKETSFSSARNLLFDQKALTVFPKKSPDIKGKNLENPSLREGSEANAVSLSLRCQYANAAALRSTLVLWYVMCFATSTPTAQDLIAKSS
jgi:hypothetical protein